MPQTSAVGQYIEADLGAVKQIDAIGTRGRAVADVRVTSFELWFKRDVSASFEPVRVAGDNSVRQFEGTSSHAVEHIVSMEVPIFARVVRLYPRYYIGEIALKWALYGCSSGRYQQTKNI